MQTVEIYKTKDAQSLSYICFIFDSLRFSVTASLKISNLLKLPY